MGQKKNPSEIVAAAGWMAGLFTDLRNLVVEKGGIDDDIYRLVTPAGRPTLDKVAQQIVDDGKPVKSSESRPLLKFLDTMPIPATTKKFVVADHFKKNNADGVVISIIWDGFQSLCGAVVEEPIKEAIELRRHKLLRSETDKPIIVELGGEAAVETFFAAIWELMKLQKNGGKGKLLTNGYANIFYVRVKGVLLVVRVVWDGFGWYVFAYSVEGLNTGDAGVQVFSSNSGNLAA